MSSTATRSTGVDESVGDPPPGSVGECETDGGNPVVDSPVDGRVRVVQPATAARLPATAARRRRLEGIVGEADR
jgi:hypothetical protein